MKVRNGRGTVYEVDPVKVTAAELLRMLLDANVLVEHQPSAEEQLGRK